MGGRGRQLPKCQCYKRKKAFQYKVQTKIFIPLSPNRSVSMLTLAPAVSGNCRNITGSKAEAAAPERRERLDMRVSLPEDEDIRGLHILDHRVLRELGGRGV